MRKSTLRKTPLIKDKREQIIAKIYDDDYQDERFEKHCPYDAEFEKELDEILK